MLDEDKPFRETASMAALLVDGWHTRNRAQIANGAGLSHAARRALMDDITRTFTSVVRRADRLEAAAVAARPELAPAAPEPRAKPTPAARKMKAADAAKLLPFKGKLFLPGEPEPIAHPPAPRGGRKRKGAPLPATEGPSDAA